MAWNTIATVTDSSVLDATDMNQYIENLEYLKTPLLDYFYHTNEASNITTTSTSWASISSDFELSLTTEGEHVLVLASLVSTNAQYDVRVDGTRLGSGASSTGPGIFGTRGTTSQHWTYTLATILELSAGAHTFYLQWKATGGTATIYTTFKPWFMVRALRI